MKKGLLILLCLPMIGFAQSVPQGINYQAVARDTSGYDVNDCTQGIAGDNGLDGAIGVTEAQGLQVVADSDGQGGLTNTRVGINVTGASTSVNPYVVSTSTCSLSIGDIYAGGVIFYLDDSGCHGLVSKATDEPAYYQWSTAYFETMAFASGIFVGAQNTKKSIAIATANGEKCPAAIQASLPYGGFNDWYLPSKDELDMMYVNLHLQGFGGFGNLYYWSSTEFDFKYAWIQFFNNGYQNSNNKFYDHKDYYFNYVRAVRAF
jgi:hypothetical protein